MFLDIARFEFGYQIKSPVFWVASIAMLLLCFGSVASSNVVIGHGGNIHKNAATVIVETVCFFVAIYTFVTAAFVANVVIRDDQTGYWPIMRTTQISKFDYLFGRFSGAFAAAAVSFLAVPLGSLAGALMPWVDPETLGPVVLSPYVLSYLIWGLPGILISSALFFTLSTVTRSMMWTYVGVVAFFIVRAIMSSVLNKPGLENIASILDPFGRSAFGQITQYWTSVESNNLIPPFAGLVALNRLIWLCVSISLLCLSFALFRFEPRHLAGVKKRGANVSVAQGPVAISPPSATFATRAVASFGAASSRSQFLARTQLDMAQVFGSPAYLVLLGLGALLSVVTLWLATDASAYGGQVYPVSRVMISALYGSFSLVAGIVAIYYAGDLVWREKDAKTNEIIDATPTPNWVFLLPKISAISLVLISTLIVSALVGISVQLAKGFGDIDIGKYIWWYIVPQSVDFILLAAIAMVVQILVPNKFLGWGVIAVFMILQIVAGNLGLENHLYLFGGTPTQTFSDISGTGISGQAAWWFRAYWIAVTSFLLVVGDALWRRGTEARLTPRLLRLSYRLRGGAGAVAAFALVAAIGLGSFIYYNIAILNHYQTKQDTNELKADLEKTLLRYENVPQPKVIDVSMRVDLKPKALEVVTDGVYLLQNRTPAPLREVHVRFPLDAKVLALSVEGARQTTDYDRFNYRILTFDRPMQPGERRRLTFRTWYGQKGFKNSEQVAGIAASGSFISNSQFAPELGMDRKGLLQDRATRRKYHLLPELRVAKLEDLGARQFDFIRKDADFANADITVVTDADQTAIAPGYLVSDTMDKGRRAMRFRTDAPILPFFSILSGRYATRSINYKGIAATIYYDPRHYWHVQRMIHALEIGLDYDQKNFSPYQFRQIRVVEFPAPIGEYAQSFPSTIVWSEALGFSFDARDTSRIDLVTYIAAHELAHQWWAHQVIGADVQGATMLLESFAQYSALMAMEHRYGRDHIGRFLKYEQDGYLKGRAADVLEEVPLYRVENQQYIHYRKGSIQMYRLKDQVGEDVVNRALRRLLHDFGMKAAPYPTTLDFLKILREEVGPDAAKQQVITDLFERIALFDLKAQSVSVRSLPNGKFDVAVTVLAGSTPGSTGKEYDDGHGNVIARPPLNENVEIGLFASEPDNFGFEAKDVITMRRIQLHSGLQTFHLMVDRKPSFAGVDPYHTLIDRNTADNVVAVN
jgi:ABC-2 type transport system permease protein